MIDQKLHDAICRKLADEGKVIEAGWMALRFLTIPDDAPPVQLEEMRKAYYAGAQHLFATMMSHVGLGCRGDRQRPEPHHPHLPGA